MTNRDKERETEYDQPVNIRIAYWCVHHSFSLFFTSEGVETGQVIF